MSTSDWGSADLGGTIGTLQAGGAIRLAHWPGAPGGRGTVILVQGYGEFMEAYGETVGEFRRRGYAVVSFDFRGQGGSARAVAGATHLSRFRNHVNDVCAAVRFAAETDLPRPFFVAAHSMGGLAALHAAPALASEVARMVLFAPLLEVAQLPVAEPVARAGAMAACWVGFSRRRVAKSITGQRDALNNPLTTDPDRYNAYCALTEANPALVSGPPTFGWVREVLAAAAAMRRRSETPLAIPTLMLASGRDAVVSTPAIDRFARAVPGGGLVMLPEARHQLFLERDGLRNAAFAAFDAFVEQAASDAPSENRTSRASRRGRPLRFEEMRTGPPVSVDAPKVAPDPPRMADVLAAAAPTATDDLAGSGAPETARSEPTVRDERRTLILKDGEDDALFVARRRTRIVPPPGPAPAGEDTIGPFDAPEAPAVAPQPASPAAARSAEDSVDALMRTTRRRPGPRGRSARRMSSEPTTTDRSGDASERGDAPAAAEDAARTTLQRQRG